MGPTLILSVLHRLFCKSCSTEIDTSGVELIQHIIPYVKDFHSIYSGVCYNERNFF